MAIAQFPVRNNLLRETLRTASTPSVLRASRRASLPSSIGRSDRHLGPLNDDIRAEVAALIDEGFTQTALAQRLGLSQSWLSRWVNEKRPDDILDVAALEALVTLARELRDSAARIETAVTKMGQ